MVKHNTDYSPEQDRVLTEIGLRYAASMGLKTEDALDAIQEAKMRVVQAEWNPDEREAPPALFIRILHNQIVNHYRKVGAADRKHAGLAIIMDRAEKSPSDQWVLKTNCEEILRRADIGVLCHLDDAGVSLRDEGLPEASLKAVELRQAKYKSMPTSTAYRHKANNRKATYELIKTTVQILAAALMFSATTAVATAAPPFVTDEPVLTDSTSVSEDVALRHTLKDATETPHYIHENH